MTATLDIDAMLAKRDCTIDELAKQLKSADVVHHLDELLEAGANPDLLASKLTRCNVDRCCFQLLEAGADKERVLCRMSSCGAYNHRRQLMRDYGVTIDEIVDHMSECEISKHASMLLSEGADIALMNQPEIVRRIQQRLSANDSYIPLAAMVDLGLLDEALQRLRNSWRSEPLDGERQQKLAAHLTTPLELIINRDALARCGYQVDVATAIKQMSNADICRYVDQLVPMFYGQLDGLLDSYAVMDDLSNDDYSQLLDQLDNDEMSKYGYRLFSIARNSEKRLAMFNRLQEMVDSDGKESLDEFLDSFLDDSSATVNEMLDRDECLTLNIKH